MPDLLLELRSEEIPARMQRKAAGDLKKMVTDGLVAAGLTYEGCQEYWTPRRLALDLRGLAARSRDVREERKGPSVSAPEQAVQGFLRSAGLASLSGAEIRSDPKKGDFYVAVVSKPGRAAEEIIATLLPEVIRAVPWPKSMRWGAASGPKGRSYEGIEGRGGEALRWVRPLQSILCTFGPETADPVVVDFTVDGIRSGNVTYGHRFHAPGPIPVRRFGDYVAKLEAAKVVLDAERRKEIILSDARNLAFANGLDLVEDEGLLEEVSGLVEWPVVLLGEFEADFLSIPAEVIRLTIRQNQKCFVTKAPISPLVGEMSPKATEGGAVPPASPPIEEADRHGSRSTLPPSALPGISPTGGEISQSALSNRFILTANIEAKDGGREIALGNGKVVRARLSDALHFWKTDQADLPDLDRLKASAEKFGLDLKKPLDQRMARLDHLGVTFHARLGTQGERVARIARLAEELAPVVARSPTSPLRGGRLAEGEAGGGIENSSTPTPQHQYPADTGAGDPPLKGEGISKLARRAAVLAKADLQTEVVGEFPELQGVMGRKYAALQGEHPSVAAAIEEHYKPQGPSDRVPTDPVSIAVALADKLDTLVGFWAIDEKPTGSKDPYALRRAALGVIRIVVENGVRLNLIQTFFEQIHIIFWNSFSEAYLPIEQAAQDDLNHLARIINDPLGVRLLDWDNLFSNQQEKYGNFLWSLRGDGAVSLKEYDISLYASHGFHGALSDAEREITKGEGKLEFLAVKKLHSRVVEIAERDRGERGLLNGLPSAGIGAAVRETLSGRYPQTAEFFSQIALDLLSFFHDRLKVYLRDQGARHDLIDAVLVSAPTSPLWGGRREAAGGGSEDSSTPTPDLRSDPPHRGEGGSPSANDDLLLIVRRVEALSGFLDTDDGRNLLAGTKRAVNILAAEEKKGTAIAPSVDPSLFRDKAEKALYAAVNQAEKEAGEAIERQDFSAAMRALSALREPVDSFFEEVLVNDEDPLIRANRLALLARIRNATGQVADFSKIAG